MFDALTSREFRFDWSWELPATPEALWPLVSDTDAFNRDTGLPPVRDARAPGEELEEARRRLRLSIMGVGIEWEELPFEWVRPRRFGVVRRYSRGPVAEMRVLAELEPLPASTDDPAAHAARPSPGPGQGSGGRSPDAPAPRTRLTYRVTARPAGLLGLAAIPLQIGLLSRWSFGRVFRRYGEAAAERERSAVAAPGPASGDRSADRTRLAGMEHTLVEAGVEAEVAARLSRHLSVADDEGLQRLRPYLLAGLWDLPRRPLLEACLHATRHGFLQLHWDVLCPLCRGVKESAPSLSELRRRGVHCDTCLIDFSGDFSDSVEVTFRPTPAVRKVEQRHFCVAGPQVTPHVVAQQLLAPGESRTIRPLLEPGRYRLRRHGTARGVVLDVPGAGPAGADASAPSEDTFRLEDDGWVGEARALSRRPTLALENRCGRERLVVLERTAWGDDAVTAAEVTRLQLFRDLFTDDVLRAGDFAEVGTLSVLFTDLRHSTRIYRRTGDAPAFGRVMKHFEVLKATLAEHDGTLVKTIGDAVMAVFDAPEKAVAAALASHERLRAEVEGEPTLVLKAGIHAGPCIAVTLNERLDYFGTTVNVAARLEGMSDGGDVVISDEVRRDPGVEALLADGGVRAEASSREIRGLEEGPVTVWRLTSAMAGPSNVGEAGADRRPDDPGGRSRGADDTGQEAGGRGEGGPDQRRGRNG